MKRKSHKSGFTLVEVLITLAIIGIVAMMVLPILVSSYKKKTAEARIDKFFSTMQQAILFSEANNGDIDNWDEPVSQSEVSDWFDKYIAKYIKNSVSWIATIIWSNIICMGRICYIYTIRIHIWSI